MTALVIGRAVTGLTRAGMYLGVIILLSMFTTPKERPAYFAMLGVTLGWGTMRGPTVEGAFADSSAMWRWAFYIKLVISGLSAPGAPLGIEIVGTLLQVDALVADIMAISFGGVLYNWDYSRIIGLFVCFGVLLIALGLPQQFAILTTRFRRVFLAQYVRQEMYILLTQKSYSHKASSDQALKAGVRLLPYIIPLAVASMANEALMEKLKSYVPWFLVDGILIIASNAMLYYISLTIDTGFIVNAPFSVAQWLVPPKDIALAVTFIACAQVAGVTNSLAVANAVFINFAHNSVQSILPGVPKGDVQAAMSGIGGRFPMTLGEATQTLILEAIVGAIQKVFILGIVVGIVTVGLSAFVNRAAIDLMEAPSGAR
ncbi:MAG: hypothetical protein Q9184_005792 [Pyrenodesmia sp. 2 TL-2023]